MGFDINGFKNAFLSEMKRAANLDSQNNRIDTQSEAREAKNIQSTFKSELGKVSDPIGDSFVKSTDNKNIVQQEVSIEELTALLDDPDLNVSRVNQLIQEKPVKSLGNVGKTGSVKQPQELADMAEISDADTEGVKFYTDLAIAEGRDGDIKRNTDASEEGMDILGPEMFDAFMEALYAA